MTIDADNLQMAGKQEVGTVDADFYMVKRASSQRQLKAKGEHFSTDDMRAYDEDDFE